MMPGFTGKSDSFMQTSVTNDGFFPDVVLGDLQRDYRIPTQHAEETVTHHVLIALGEVNSQLKAKKLEWTDLGYNTLEDVPADKLNNISQLVIWYQRAVAAKTKALLIPQLNSLNTKDKDPDTEDQEQYWHSECRSALSAILGKTKKLTVELL